MTDRKEMRIIVVVEGHGPSRTREDAEMLFSVSGSIARAFGGFTRWDAVGGWVDDSGKYHGDAVVVFDVAVPTDPASVNRMRRIAEAAARMGGQQTYYVRYPDGSVHVHETEEIK